MTVEPELDEFGGHPMYLTGRFSASFDRTRGGEEAVGGLSLGEALEWGHARADRVVVLFEEGEYSAGAVPVEDAQPWPPADLARTVERRRAPHERWKDRTATDTPVEWAVRAWLAPPQLSEHLDRIPADDSAVAEAAAASCANRWDADSLDAFLADLREAKRQAGGAETFGWTSAHAASYSLSFTVRSPTARAAMRSVAERLVAPRGWRTAVTVTPHTP
jgi:hypothetical protein